MLEGACGKFLAIPVFWNDGVMEYWKKKNPKPNIPVLHYSSPPSAWDGRADGS